MFTLFRYSREAAAKGFDMKPRFFLSSFSVSFLTLSLLLTSSVTAGRTGEEKEEKKTSTPFRPASARDERWRVNQRHSAAPTAAAAAAPRANQRREGQPPRPSSAISLRRAYASQQTALPETNVQEGFVKFRSTQEHINNNNRNSNNLRNDPPAAAAAAAARPRPQSAPGAAAADQGNVAKRRKSRQVFVRRNWVADNGALNINKDKSLNLTSSASKYSYQARCPIDVQGFERVRVSLRFEVTEGNFRFALINKDGERIIQNGELMDFILPHKLPRHPRVWFEFEPKGDDQIQFVISNDQALRPSKMKIEDMGFVVEVLDKPTRNPSKGLGERFMTGSRFFSQGPKDVIHEILYMLTPLEGRAVSRVCKLWSGILNNARHKIHSLRMLKVDLKQFQNDQGAIVPNRFREGFQAAAEFHYWKPQIKRNEDWRDTLDAAADIGMEEAISARLDGYAYGWYGYPEDSAEARARADSLADNAGPLQKWAIERRINGYRYRHHGYPVSAAEARRLTDGLANNPGLFQEWAIRRRIYGYEKGLSGYGEDLVQARRLNDALADNPGPLREWAKHRRVNGYRFGHHGYPLELEIARDLNDVMADTPGPYQRWAIMYRVLGYEGGYHGYPKKPEEARKLLDRLAHNPGPLQDWAVMVKMRDYIHDGKIYPKEAVREEKKAFGSCFRHAGNIHPNDRAEIRKLLEFLLAKPGPYRQQCREEGAKLYIEVNCPEDPEKARQWLETLAGERGSIQRYAMMEIIIYKKIGLYGYPQDSKIAHQLTDALANSPGIRQKWAILEKLDCLKQGCCGGYAEGREKARYLIDGLADNPEPLQRWAVRWKILDYWDGHLIYPKDLGKARKLLDSLADNPGPYQVWAMVMRIEGYAGGRYAYPAEPEKAFELADILTSRDSFFEDVDYTAGCVFMSLCYNRLNDGPPSLLQNWAHQIDKLYPGFMTSDL